MKSIRVRVCCGDEATKFLVSQLLQAHGVEFVDDPIGQNGRPVLVVEQIGLLTDKEVQILQAMADCDRLEEVAARCHIHPSTVRKHVEHLHHKLGVHNQARLIAEGFRRGWIH